jgi:hypothetical protein
MTYFYYNIHFILSIIKSIPTFARLGRLWPIMQFFSQMPEHRPRVESEKHTTVDEAAMLLRDRPSRINETNILNFKTIYISGFLLCVSL